MNKTLSDSELKHLTDFIGYGRLDADIWFLGFEERHSDPLNLLKRLDFQDVEDSANAQAILGESPDNFGEENLQGAWRSMCAIMLKLEGRDSSPENIQEYRTGQLGRLDGSVLLAYLFPVPMPTGNEWNNSTLAPQYSSSNTYHEALRTTRFEIFRHLINQYLPKIIVAYDKSYWPDYQELFQDYKLSQSGPFLVGWNANTVIILCEHLAGEAMQAQIDSLVTLILENSLSIEMAKPTGPIPLTKAELARQKKENSKKFSAEKRKPTTKHNPSDPYCVCAYCLGYEND